MQGWLIPSKNLWCIVASIGFLVSCLHSNRVTGQEIKQDINHEIKIAFLNTQNLFDTIDNPYTEDNEFTPKGARRWNGEKYYAKVEALAAIIRELDADIMGLCEVENRDVVVDLVRDTGEKYDIIHYESRDSRGIDVCLIYRPDVVSIKSSEIVFQKKAPRGILKVTAKVQQSDLLIYVAHLPSQRGGRKASMLRDSILNALEVDICENISQNIVVMGDMNTEPITVTGLTNLASPLAKEGLGSYCYRGIWSMLDQFLVSPSLVKLSSEMNMRVEKRMFDRGQNFNQPTDHNAIYFILKL